MECSLALAFAGLAFAAAALPPLLDFAAAPLLLALGGVAAAFGADGFEPPGLPKNEAMSRCLLPDIWASLTGACALRRHADGARRGRCRHGASLECCCGRHSTARTLGMGSLSRAA